MSIKIPGPPGQPQQTGRDSVITLQTNRHCHFANIGLMLIRRPRYSVCWDAPKRMHTLEMNILIFKCTEVIICIDIISLFKLKYKKHTSMYNNIIMYKS